MKNRDVVVGGVYKAKVGRNVVEIRVEAENPRGGWDAVSLATGKPIRVKTAQRLRASASRARPFAPSPAPASQEATRAPEAAPGPQGAKLSGLAAAAKVLGEAGTPLNTKVMVDQMLAKGYWTTGGKTPAATIYAAILREIQAKGDQARFVKTERGKFALAS